MNKTDILLLIIGAIVIVFLILVLAPYNTSSQEIVFHIQKGDGLNEISFNLREQGLIRSRDLFYVFAMVRAVNNNLQAGKYLLSPSMSINAILNKLSRGEVIKNTITIIEGWNLRDIAWYFENKGMFQAEELFEIAGLPLQENNLEGYLFPDTYEIGEDSLADIVKKMTDNFKDKVDEAIDHNTIIMASLLEKEVIGYEDKRIAAGILWKRLNNQWPLQVDASITYLTGMAEISKQDLEIDSPYNTYMYKGLPFGPICNPGLESIQAALYYIDTDYWFYLTTKDGETIFSKTLEEHNINRAKWLK